MHANDTFYSFECSRSAYKEVDHWNLSYVFPALTVDVPTGDAATPGLKWYKKQAPDGTWYKTQAASPQEAKDKLEKEIAAATQEKAPADVDDTLTGFDYLNGHLETLSGNTFLVRPGEQDMVQTVFTVTACFFPGLRGRQKDCSTNLMLRTPMCTRPREEPTKCEWKRGDQFHTGSNDFKMPNP